MATEGVVGPAKHHHVSCRLLGGIVGQHRRGAGGMRPDQPVRLRHGGVKQLEHQFVEQPAGEWRENLHAGGAELVDGALSLLGQTMTTIE